MSHQDKAELKLYHKLNFESKLFKTWEFKKKSVWHVYVQIDLCVSLASTIADTTHY
jgi:hypothetical protein